MTHKIVVKFYAQDVGGMTDADFVPILHGWIQNHAVSDHILVDVASYAPVHNGPGTLLVSHEANFYLDRLDGFLGFSYSRKQPLDGSFADQLRYCFAQALEGCQRLQEDPKVAGRLRFRTDEAVIRLNDRLLAPNTAETFDRVRGDIDQVARQLWRGANVEIEHYPVELQLFEVRLRSDQPDDVATLLARVGTVPA